MTTATPAVPHGPTVVARDRPDAPLLEVRDLTCTLDTPRGEVRAVDGISFSLRQGETLGIAGESGSGKSLLARSIMRIAPGDARLGGSVRYDGVDLLSLPARGMRHYLGSRLAMVFQDPMTALNPVVPIERQIGEGPRRHLGLTRAQARARVLDLLDLVGIPEPRKRLGMYPHQFSGGMRQRVMIAIALACDPQLLIADEATTALDVTVQKQILDLIQEIQRERDMAVIMVSHDLGVLAGRADRVMVMYGGRVMESAPTRELFHNARHQYTDALLDAIPRMGEPRHSLLRAIPGSPPDAAVRVEGCRFAPRCHAVTERCRQEEPEYRSSPTASEHAFACFEPVESSHRRAQP